MDYIWYMIGGHLQWYCHPENQEQAWQTHVACFNLLRDALSKREPQRNAWPASAQPLLWSQ